MLRPIIFLMFLCLASTIFSQAPQALNYQAIARNADGSIIAGQPVGVRFSVIDGSAAGNILYQETHQATTNKSGLFTLSIGKGITIAGNFSTISWGGDKFLKVEIDPQGSTNYQLQGTTQLLSVPYALYAEKSGTAGPQGATGPMGPTGPAGVAGANGTQGPPGITGAQGAAGATGLQGATGVQGAAGINGKTVLNGTNDPTAVLGTDGDFYLNTTTVQLFGPKTSGNWGPGTTLKGIAGATGSPGLKSLIDLDYFSGSTGCPAGGVIVKSGIDQNNNNVLEAIEVDHTKQICFTQSSTVPLDKVIIFPFSFSGNTSSTTGVYGGDFINFNKDNYTGIDSVILICEPYVFQGGLGNTATVELYNLTSNTPIANSTIITGRTYTVGFLNSANVYNYLPAQDILLGVRIKSGINGQSVGSGKCYLYMYRR